MLGLLLLVLLCSPVGTSALPLFTTGVEVTLEVCPVFEVRIQGQPHEPVIDPNPANNVYSGRVFVCPKELNQN